METCLSGLKRQFRKLLSSKGLRGFESLSLRQVCALSLVVNALADKLRLTIRGLKVMNTVWGSPANCNVQRTLLLPEETLWLFRTLGRS